MKRVKDIMMTGCGWFFLKLFLVSYSLRRRRVGRIYSFLYVESGGSETFHTSMCCSDSDSGSMCTYIGVLRPSAIHCTTLCLSTFQSG